MPTKAKKSTDETPLPEAMPDSTSQPFVYQKPVAICTLTDEALCQRLQQEGLLTDVIVAPLNTENIGIEQLIEFSVSQPALRFIIVCGIDGSRAVGHLPGQSFLALIHNGLDENQRIIGAEGKRPVIKNVPQDAVEHFRKHVTVIDMLGNQRVDEILLTAQTCMANNPGPAPAFQMEPAIQPLIGWASGNFVQDPNGYFIISIDASHQKILLKHYLNNGTYHRLIEGKRAQELYEPALELGLVSRLDHAAYLGRELVRAELALREGKDFVQDALCDED